MIDKEIARFYQSLRDTKQSHDLNEIATFLPVIARHEAIPRLEDEIATKTIYVFSQ